MRLLLSKSTMVCAKGRNETPFSRFPIFTAFFNPHQLMKKLLVLLSLVVALHRVSAVSDYEPFANATTNGGSPYTVGLPLCSGFLAQGTAPQVLATNATGGVWGCVSNEAGAPVTGIPVITSGNLTYPGLTNNLGNSLSIPPATGNMGRLTLPFQVGSGQCYYSFLLQVTNVSTLNTANTANFFAGFQDTLGAGRAAIARAQAYVAATKSGSGYVLGIGKNSPSVAHTVYDTTVHNVGDVLLVVGSYDYTTTGHPAKLWINPATNTFGAGTPPSATVTATTGSAELNSPGIQSFVLGCFTAPPPGCVVDDLRVGLTWALVTGAPDIQTQPASQTTNAGTTATFSVFATGAAPLSYQWMNSSGNLSDGGQIVGSSTATLSITNCTLNNVDTYSVIVSNAYGSITSSVASLNVNDPWIDSPPSPQTLPPQSTAVFTVVAGGVPTLTYGWLKDGVPLSDGGNISGSETASLTVSDLSFSDAGGYSVSVTNGLGSVVQSTAAQLNITDPAIIGQPESSTNNYGTTASFQVTAEGQSSISYQWYQQGVGPLSDGGGISGSQSNTLTLTGVSYTNAGTYYVTATDLNGSAPSSPATLTVIEPIITAQPVSATVAQGNAATFSVTAIGAPTITYQWSKNGVAYSGDGGNITGSQTSTLTVSGVSAADDGSYSVLVTDASGMSAASTNAVLTVLTQPSITAQPSPLTLTPGNNATFAVGTSGAAPITYQWYSNSVLVASGTNFAYTLTNVQLGMSGGFSVIVSNALGAATSSVVPLTIVPSIHLYNTNLVVVRVGNGAEAQDFTGSSVFLDQYTTGGAYLNTVCIPDSGASALIEIAPDVNGSTLTGTELSLSEDGLELVLSGYNTPRPYSATLFTSTSSAVPRGVALINSGAHYLLPISDHTAFNDTYFRGAASDGTNNFWGAGNAGGTYYFGLGAPAVTVQSAFANLRSVDIFNGDLFIVSGASGDIGILEWTGLPTNAVAPVELFIPGATPTDLAVDPTSTIMYLGTSVGIMKYQFDGTFWDFQYTITGNAVRYVTADFTQSPPVVYATTSDSTSDRLLAIVDNGIGSAETVLATAGVNQNFRGVRFGPGEPFFNFSTDPSDIILTWNGLYNLQASTNAAGQYVTIPSATSPYTNAFTNASQLYFRLQQ
jgi:hypothetical protein